MKKELIINKSKTILVILAGGQSRRFGGGYKTLYKFNKISILDRIIQNFKKLEVEIVLNANSNEDQFLKTGLHLIKDELEKYNVESIPVQFRHSTIFGGGLHCSTLDLERENE